MPKYYYDSDQLSRFGCILTIEKIDLFEDEIYEFKNQFLKEKIFKFKRGIRLLVY
ncbi:MAG: hypothetical protein QXN55_02215 [Candidatus Nitrosotenuis sp.]